MDLPTRKRTKLKGFDYSTPAAYFVTVCTHNRKCLLSRIVGSIHESTAHELPKNILTPYGKCVEEYINQIESKYRNVKVDKYVMMPNHFHILLSIMDDKRSIHESTLQGRSVLSKVVGFIKMNSSKQIHLTYNHNVWQRNYHDHIIRDEKDHKKIWEYIDTNIYKWELDCFYTNEAENLKLKI